MIKPILATALCALSLATLSTGVQAKDNHKQLISLYMKENELCRGGPGDLKSTNDACDRRSVISVKLKRLGWCLISKTGTSMDQYWGRCK